MESRKAALLIWARMACSDGEILDEEKHFLHEMAEAVGIPDSVDDLFNQAQTADLDSLYDQIPKYEDRFFVLLRSYMMARVDGCVDAEEESMFVSMEKRFEIKREDGELVRRTAENMENPESEVMDPRIEEYYQASSFSEPVI
ncbi:MAG TPA: TerB family tellurite resistance protein [Verrucomicrobiales bacterium]|nr:TerB family tellurite resistance protein [Verrucomicrobiales bacterium]